MDSNKKTIINMVISIIVSLASPMAIVYFTNRFPLHTDIIVISALVGLGLGIVQMLIVGFSDHYVERYVPSFVFLFGFALNITACILATSLYVTGVWYIIYTAVTSIIMQLIWLFASMILGIFILAARQKQ